MTAVNLLDNKLEPLVLFLLDEVQSSLYSRSELTLLHWHGLSGVSFKKVFTLTG